MTKCNHSAEYQTLRKDFCCGISRQTIKKMNIQEVKNLVLLPLNISPGGLFNLLYFCQIPVIF
jgi:hypothetical protein